MKNKENHLDKQRKLIALSELESAAKIIIKELTFEQQEKLLGHIYASHFAIDQMLSEK